MFAESIRYFNGERLVEYSNTDEDVNYISYKAGNPVVITFKDETSLKIQSPFIEYKSKWIQDDSDNRALGLGGNLCQ